MRCSGKTSIEWMPFPPETTCAQAQLKPTTENCSVSPVAEATSLVEPFRVPCDDFVATAAVKNKKSGAFDGFCWT